MNYEQAEQAIKERVINSDNLCEFHGFDGYYDTSWSGYFCDEIELEDGTFLLFDGDISFIVNDSSEVENVTITSINAFEHFDSDNETITNFKAK